MPMRVVIVIVVIVIGILLSGLAARVMEWGVAYHLGFFCQMLGISIAVGLDC